MLICLTADHLVGLHRRIIAETGGPHGVRDLGGVQSAAARPFRTYDGQALYPTLEEKAAAWRRASPGTIPSWTATSVWPSRPDASS